MSTDDEYRKQANYAQDMAERLTSPLDKESWLRVAQGWLSLIRKRPQTAAENFNEELEERGTKQDDSTGSH